jgi:hypothetical protein
MSTGESECPKCRLYQGEVALLRAENAGLRDSVLALTRHPTEGAAVLEMVGMHEPQRLALAGPFTDGHDLFYRVSLSHRDQLSARCEIFIADPAVFWQFFRDLAQHKGGWEGEKTVTSLEGQLAITCTYEGKKYRPEISINVSCALGYPSFDPYWTVQLHLDVDPESLEGVAARARTVFANAAAEPDSPTNRGSM